MGNSQHRYITNNEASEIIGNDTWSRLRAKLERGNLKTVDFVLFCNILQSRFERIPPLLLECLFRAFTSDFHQKLDIDTFLSSYAVLFSQDLGMKKRFLFRIYETPTGGSGVGNVGSVIEKKHLTEILYCAYADKSSHYHSIERFSESFFPKKKEFISKTKFEQWQGRLDLLTDWVAEVLGIFIEPLPPKLLSLQKKYSSPMEAEVLMKKYNMSNDLYQRLYHEFFHHCQVTYKPELSLKQWLAWVCPQYLTVDLALILFAASTDTFKTVWRFIDFAEFTLVYGCGTLEAKATAIVSAFVKAAILRRDHSVDTSPVEGDVEGRSLSALSLDPFVRDFLTYMIFLLCQTVEVDPSPQDYSSPQDVYLDDEEVEEEAATYLRGKSIDEPRSSSIVQNTSSPPSSSFERQRRRSYSLNLSAEPTVRTNATFKHNLSHQPASSMLKESGMTSSSDDPKKSPISALLDLAICSMQASSAIMKEKFRKIVPPVLIEQLDQIKESTTIDAFARLIVQHHAILPGLRDLSITTCCLFSVEPLSPLDEKEFITELTLRYLKLYPPSQQRPYGPLGTEWYLVPKSWIDAWRMFVGKNRSEYGEFNGKSSSSATSPTGSSTSNAANNIRKSQFAPGFIDNWSIIKKTGAKALLPNLVLGQDFEVVPPTVYAAFSSWYGGGPAVSRRVVLAPSTSMSEVTEIEFYPLTLVIVECDQQGKVAGQPKEMLFSKTMTIQEMVLELAQDRKLDSSKIRLWNYAKPLWKEQYILSPELTVLQANLLDGQVILLEASQSDGSWPRSLLHAYLDNEEKQLQQAQVSEEENGEETRRGGSIEEGSKNKETTNTVVQLKRNNGLVGMDNLGNTCYLNSSLQALLHTDLLVEYFLSQSYLKDVNPQNKHGFGGRVANIFGKVVTDLWSTNRNCITPRYVYNEIAALRDQFAGNEQHDAHELLAFLLDGLSEDLNLVHSKPYTIQPDSDGRQDEELANIWWENHLKRDRSVIQALFTGQFKSVMTCSACAYSSARFEPFNFLTVPIPEDNFRVMLVIVVPRKLQETARVAVRVPKIGTVEDIVDRIKAMGFDGIIANDTPPESAPPLSSLVPQYFVAGELVNSRIKSFINLDRKLDTIRDNELLVIFHVTALPKKLMERYQASRLKLQSQAHQTIARSESGSVSSINKASMFGDDKSDNPSSLDSSTQKKELPVPPSFNAANISQNEQYVRVAFSQRRISYFEGAYCGVAGFDFFRLEAFGMPILEVLPNRMKCSELYQLMETRLSVYLKSSVKSYLKHLRQQLHSSTTLISLSRPTSSSMLSSATPTTEQKDPRWTEGKRVLDKAGVDDFQVISSVTTEEVVAGPIPTRGFSLRLITGGSGATVCCSRCHWLNRCQGCILPDREDVEYELLDGESIAVDWHYVVFEDLLDAQMASTLVTHPSIAHEKAFLSDTKVPLERCLDKFNEQESLEGVICPRCHEDNTLKKTFMLWRLPPVLIIQLKRFQFDRTSRRKLNNRIDFPLENLDLLNYLAPTRLKRDKSTTKREVKKSEDGHDVQGDETGEIASASIEKEVLVEITPKDSSEDLCSSYDLYSVIHHIGALGGGHYVTTVRFNQKDKLSQSTGSQLDRFRMPKKLLAKGFRALTSSTTESVDAAHVNTNSDHSTNTNGSLGSPGLIEDERRESNPDFHWYTFNDNIVSEVSDLSDINSPSAYVLFYIRKDVENSADIDSLLKTQLMINSKDIRGHDPKETLNSTHGLSSPQKDPKDKQSLAGDQSAREESSASRNDQQPPSSNSRRNEYIVAKKLRIPSAKKQSKDVTPNNDTYNTAQSTTIPTNNTREASATSRQQTNSETDNNCAIS